MTEAADIHTWDGPTMDVAIKIWRVDEDGERDLVSYELEAPEWASARRARPHHDRHDGTLMAPQELPYDDLRLLRDAHGRPRSARLQGAHEADRPERPRPGDLADGEPADHQGPRRRHGPVLAEDPRRQALARLGLRRGDGARTGRLPAADERDPKGGRIRAAAVSEERDGGGSRFAAAPAKGCARRRPARRDGRTPQRAESTSTDSTAPVLPSNAPKGVDPRTRSPSSRQS
jgi:hypothetical protein